MPRPERKQRRRLDGAGQERRSRLCRGRSGSSTPRERGPEALMHRWMGTQGRSVRAPVELLLEIGLQRGLRGLVGRPAASAAPAPCQPAERDRAREDARDRKPPGEDVEAAVRGRGEDLRPVLGDELLLDLALRVAAVDQAPDQRSLLVRECGVGLVERRLADEAHDLRLDLGQRRMLLARERDRRGDGERRGGHDRRERPHDSSAWSIACFRSGPETAPWNCVLP